MLILSSYWGINLSLSIEIEKDSYTFIFFNCQISSEPKKLLIITDLDKPCLQNKCDYF